MMRNRRARYIAVLRAIGLGLALAACTLPGTSPSASPSLVPPTVVGVSPTPTEPVPPRVFLLMPAEDGDPAHAATDAVLDTMALDNGWNLSRLAPGVDTLNQALAEKPLLMVAVATGLGESLVQAAAAHGEARWVAIDEAQVLPAANMLVIGPAAREDQMAFLAGALVGLANTNDRVGWIGESGSVRATLYRNGFIHGVRYTCPLCWLFEETTAPGAWAEAGVAAAQLLLPKYIDTAGAFPSPAGEGALLALAAGPVRVAGSRPGFAAQVFGGQPEAADKVLGEVQTRPERLLAEYLPRYLAGELFAEPLVYSIENGGLSYAPFASQWITLGLQRNLEEMLARLASGELQIGIDRATGEEQ